MVIIGADEEQLAQKGDETLSVGVTGCHHQNWGKMLAKKHGVAWKNVAGLSEGLSQHLLVNCDFGN